jgi:hypothetical protein
MWAKVIAKRVISDIFCAWADSLASLWLTFPIMLPSGETRGKRF